jgi:hypothetical protein
MSSWRRSRQKGGAAPQSPESPFAASYPPSREHVHIRATGKFVTRLSGQFLRRANFRKPDPFRPGWSGHRRELRPRSPVMYSFDTKTQQELAEAEEIREASLQQAIVTHGVIMRSTDGRRLPPL